MSRMTSAQVIALGQYLDPDFDPTSLTVSQLLGVLGFHNINYPTPYSKPKLVHVFNEEIKTRSSKFKRERLKKENSIASEDGITDGLTGQPLGDTTKAPPARRSSRRSSHVPIQDEISPVRPEPPKRRRSSAQPSLGGPSRKVAPLPIQQALYEESEPEDDEVLIRKAVRSKKTSETAGAHARRVSNPAADDSGWEDNNIFQSGAESSSPVRPPPVRRAPRKSMAVPRKSRKSSSAPPQMLPSPSPPRPSYTQEEAPLSPSQSKFEPQLPFSVTRETRLIAPEFPRSSLAPVSPVVMFRPDESDNELDLGGRGSNSDDDRLESREDVFEESAAEEQQAEGNDPVVDTDDGKKDLPRDGQIVVRRRPSPSTESTSLPWSLRYLLVLFAIAAASGVVNYKMESAPLGYCDTGTKTNYALEELKGRRLAVEACNRENRTLLYLPPLSIDSAREGKTAGEGEAADLTPCPLLPLPLPHPETCTPCPGHATCTQHSVSCDNGYLLRPHPLLFFLPASSSPHRVSLSLSSTPSELIWRVVSELTDGLPGLGSVAFPPRCMEDPKRKRNIGVLGKAVEAVLGQERGRRLCAAEVGEHPKDTEGGEAKRWGVELEELRDVMKKKTALRLLPTFDDTLNEAIQQLIQWGGVIIGEDRNGNRYLAHKTPDLTWNCALTVKSREIWAEWRTTVLGIIVALIGLSFGRTRRVQKQNENKRAAELVPIALDTLRNQELAHHTDPITTPQPYLSSLQLRDLILQDEHSIPTRKRLWDQVERVVEGNANVRANLQEIHGGDEMRVWRWVGNAGRGPEARKQI